MVRYNSVIVILCEIYRRYLPFWRGMPAKGTHGTLMRSDWQNDASGGSQPGEFLLPSLHYSPCTVAATMKFVSLISTACVPAHTNWPPSSKTPAGRDWPAGNQSSRRHVPLEEVADSAITSLSRAERPLWRRAADQRDADCRPPRFPGRWRRGSAPHHYGGDPVALRQRHGD